MGGIRASNDDDNTRDYQQAVDNYPVTAILLESQAEIFCEACSPPTLYFCLFSFSTLLNCLFEQAVPFLN